MERFQTYHSGFPPLARAVIRENKDPEKKGRVRVAYPWLHGDSADVLSDWARVCTSYASTESGMWFLPEVGDEVLVYFENGNIDFPIVMGSLFNPKNAPPASGRTGDFNTDDKNNLKFIKTRSGHTLCFDDSDDQGGISLHDKEKRTIEIRSSDKKISLRDEKSNEIEICGEAITLKHNGGSTVRIEGSSITIEAKEIKLGQGAAQALIKGDVFQQLFNAHSHPTSWGPSGPPSTPMTPDMLSQTGKTN